jgi:hypothetical protein
MSDPLAWLTEPLPEWVDREFNASIDQMREIWSRQNALINKPWSAEHDEVDRQRNAIVGVFIPAALRRIAQLEADAEIAETRAETDAYIAMDWAQVEDDDLDEGGAE